MADANAGEGAKKGRKKQELLKKLIKIDVNK